MQQSLIASKNLDKIEWESITELEVGNIHRPGGCLSVKTEDLQGSSFRHNRNDSTSTNNNC